jgi:hypothetical protein
MPSLDQWRFVGRVLASGYPGYPLPFGHSFSKPIIKVETEYAVTYPGQKNWYRAGWMQQLTDGFNGAEINSFLVPLNQSKIFFEMTRHVSSYQLIFKPRPYLKDLAISVYEWDGATWIPEVQDADDGEILDDGVF